MKSQSHTQSPWHIPRDLERAFGVTNLKKEVSLFDRVCHNHLCPCCANFFMVNYKTGKFTAGNIEAPLLFEHSPNFLEEEGFDFYKRILMPEEYEWMKQVNQTAVEVFYQTPLADRPDLVFSYEVTGKQENGSEIILQHVITPYKLDKNSNLWLSLCRVHPTTRLRLSTLEKAFITNHQTGEQLDYIDGQFVEASAKRLASTDIQILKYKAEGLQEKDIAKKMNLSESCVKRKKHEIFNKLRVANVAAAVYKASQMGVI